MKLLELNKTTWEVEIAPELVMIYPFSEIIARDKTKTKDIAKKEIAYIYFMTDVRSEYLDIQDLSVRSDKIIIDVDFPPKWRLTEEITKAIDYCNKRKTVNEVLYEGACIAALALNDYLRDTGDLLAERTDKGAVVTSVSSVTGALTKVPVIMAQLNAANQELIKEQKITEGRTKGSKELNIFEDGMPV